ncbi:hypothetical protein TNCV_32351 [Trichonephila clavipes]|nr:hypothetical protein TNCV_32351 [Trichonephila clavipes]
MTPSSDLKHDLEQSGPFILISSRDELPIFLPHHLKATNNSQTDGREISRDRIATPTLKQVPQTRDKLAEALAVVTITLKFSNQTSFWSFRFGFRILTTSVIHIRWDLTRVKTIIHKIS